MNKKIAVILAFIIVLITPIFSNASTTIDIYANDCSINENISVNVVFKSTGIGAVKAEFRYDDSSLEFLSSDNANGSDGIGKIVLVTGSENTDSLSCTLNFKAIKAGYTSVSISTKTVLTYDEKTIENANSSCTIQINDPYYTEPAPKPSPSAVPTVPQTSKPSDTVTEPSAPVNSSTITPSPSPSRIPESECISVYISGQKHNMSLQLPYPVPYGFLKKTEIYNNKQIEVAYSEDLKLTLAYIYTDIDNTKGSYYFWDKSTGIFTKSISSNTSYLVLPLPDSLPKELSSFPKSELITDHGSAECLLTNDGSMIIYACNSGNCGYYFFDPNDLSIQRYHKNLELQDTSNITSVPKPNNTQQETNKNINFIDIILYLLAGISVILTVILIILFITKKRKNRSQ